MNKVLKIYFYYDFSDLLGKAKETDKVLILEDRIIKPSAVQSVASVDNEIDKPGAALVDVVQNSLAPSSLGEPVVNKPEQGCERITPVEGIVVQILEKLDADNNPLTFPVIEPNVASKDSSGVDNMPEESSKTLVTVCTIPVSVTLSDSGECKI